MFSIWKRDIVVEQARRREDELVATIKLGRARGDVMFRTPRLAPNETDDPYLPIGLLLAMQTGRPVVFEGPISPPLLASLDAVRADLHAWYPHLHLSEVEAPVSAPAPVPAEGQGLATFFSGGLDSFYTAVTHEAEITHLLFVHGFDVHLRDRALREMVIHRTRTAAAGLGKPLVEVETDLREFSDRFANWAWFSHAGLIAVALLLSPHFREILVPATLADAHRPEALRGEADRETWSGGLARIRSDGAEATRPEKARRVADHPSARAHLRVCWENRGGAYNCGRCPKCVRTLLNLEVAGVRERFTSFEHTLERDAIEALPLATRSDRQMIEESLWMAEAEGRHPDLVRLLRERLRDA